MEINAGLCRAVTIESSATFSCGVELEHWLKTPNLPDKKIGTGI